MFESLHKYMITRNMQAREATVLASGAAPEENPLLRLLSLYTAKSIDGLTAPTFLAVGQVGSLTEYAEAIFVATETKGPNVEGMMIVVRVERAKLKTLDQNGQLPEWPICQKKMVAPLIRNKEQVVPVTFSKDHIAFLDDGVWYQVSVTASISAERHRQMQKEALQARLRAQKELAEVKQKELAEVKLKKAEAKRLKAQVAHAEALTRQQEVQNLRASAAEQEAFEVLKSLRSQVISRGFDSVEAMQAADEKEQSKLREAVLDAQMRKRLVEEAALKVQKAAIALRNKAEKEAAEAERRAKWPRSASTSPPPGGKAVGKR